MHDIIIRGGLIVDGTGSEPFPGDIAIDGDTITAVGEVEGSGKREIDATDHAVTPGFIDLHTHMDAQAGWDPHLTPIAWHGVTTALMGNCGVTFAPCKPADREFLANMMEAVEDIPKDAILSGLPWDWESYGEYLDSIERLNPAINVAGLVGHCAARIYVMGERGVDNDPTEAEIEEIAALIGKSIKEGAVGFSTNRLLDHKLPDGRAIPGTFAKPDEILAIAKAVGDNNGFLQSVLNYTELADELILIRDQLRAAGTRAVFSAPYIPSANGEANAYDAAIKSMRAEGLDVTGLTLPRSGGFLSGLKTDIMFDTPAWRDLKKLTFSERLAAIQVPERRDILVAEVRANRATDEWLERFFWLGDEATPNYTKNDDESLVGLANAAGEHPAETWLRFMLETDGEALFHLRFFNFDLEALQGFLQSDWVLPSLGDAGAHVSQIMDSGWATFLIAHWHREKRVFSLEEAIRMLTSAPARILGFEDRGTLVTGQRADINVIDISRVNERHPQLVHDFPGGAPRLIQRAIGYRATLCNGRVVLFDDEITGERAGRVLRNVA